jgi:hypothetical protein
MIVYYSDVTENSVEQRNSTFVFKDTHGNVLTGIRNLFNGGSYVKVVLDTTTRSAYIQNADTNSYLEGKFIDCITEPRQVTSSDGSAWRYRKWSSGKVECWGKTKTFAANMSATYGNAFYVEKSFNLPSEIFFEPPFYVGAQALADGGGLIGVSVKRVTTDTISAFISNSKAANLNMSVMVYAVGNAAPSGDDFSDGSGEGDESDEWI